MLTEQMKLMYEEHFIGIGPTIVDQFTHEVTQEAMKEVKKEVNKIIERAHRDQSELSSENSLRRILENVDNGL